MSLLNVGALLTGVLIAVLLVHEAGHYVAAACLRVPIRRVVVGVGPAIIRWHARTGVEWRIGLLPIIAWVSIDNSARKTVRPARRALIVAAGPVASIAVGVGLSMLHGAGAGWHEGIAGMIPGAGSGWADAWRLVATMVENGVNAVTDFTTGRSTPSVTSTFRSAMGGPGWWNALLLASVMSLELGVVNLLPLPSMDGGQLVVLGIEGAYGERPARIAEKAMLMIGSVVLLALVVVWP